MSLMSQANIFLYGATPTYATLPFSDESLINKTHYYPSFKQSSNDRTYDMTLDVTVHGQNRTDSSKFVSSLGSLMMFRRCLIEVEQRFSLRRLREYSLAADGRLELAADRRLGKRKEGGDPFEFVSSHLYCHAS